MLAVSLSCVVFIMLRYIPLIHTFLRVFFFFKRQMQTVWTCFLFPGSPDMLTHGYYLYNFALGHLASKRLILALWQIRDSTSPSLHFIPEQHSSLYLWWEHLILFSPTFLIFSQHFPVVTSATKPSTLLWSPLTHWLPTTQPSGSFFLSSTPCSFWSLFLRILFFWC